MGVPRRGDRAKERLYSLHRSGSASETLAGAEPRRFAGLGTQSSAPCPLLRVVLLSASAPPTLSLAQACATCRPRSRLPCLTDPSFPRWYLGFLHRMGTAEGAVGPASPRLSHPPCVLRPRAAPGADQPSLLSCPCSPAAAAPSPRDPRCRGAGTQGRKEGRTGLCAGTPPPALQGTDAFQRASQALLPFT